MDAHDVTPPLRTRLAGFSMLAGGIVLAVPSFLGAASGSDDTRSRLVYDAAHSMTELAKVLVFQSAALLLLPGVAAIAGRVRGRGSAAVISGAVVYGAGLVGMFSFLVLEGLEVSMASSGPIDRRLVLVSDAIGSSPAAVPAAVLGLFLFHLIGLPWLTFGMVRARMLPLVVAVAATAGTVCAFFGTGTWVESVGWVVLGVTLVFIGWTVARPAGTSTVAVDAGSLSPSAV